MPDKLNLTTSVTIAWQSYWYYVQVLKIWPPVGHRVGHREGHGLRHGLPHVLSTPIKVRTVRDKSPRKCSLEFDLPKIKMFTAEDKRWRLVSRCWSLFLCIMGLYIETIVRYAILYEKEILILSWFSFSFEVNFHHISAGSPALNYFKEHCLFFFSSTTGYSRLKKNAQFAGLEFSYISFWQIFILDVLVAFLSRGSLRSFVLLLSKSVMQGR